MRRVSGGEASNVTGVQHTGIPVRSGATNPLILKDDAERGPRETRGRIRDVEADPFGVTEFGHPDGTDYSGGFHPEESPEEGELNECQEDLLRGLSIAITAAEECGYHGMAAQLADWHTSLEDGNSEELE